MFLNQSYSDYVIHKISNSFKSNEIGKIISSGFFLKKNNSCKDLV